MSEQLKKLVLNADFEKAKKIVQGLSFDEIQSTLSLLSHDEGSINGYAFVCFMLQSKETTEYHDMAIYLLTGGLCHLPYAYHLALFHTRRAAALDPKNPDYKEALLFFNIVPDKPLSDKEALQIAKDILKTDPKNKRALEAIERLEKKGKP